MLNFVRNRRLILPYARYVLSSLASRPRRESGATIAPTLWGPMNVGNDPSITPYLLRSGSYDAPLSIALANELFDGATVLNVGANIGYFCRLEQHFTKGEIVAVEPDPATFSILQHNVELGSGHIHAFQFAAGDMDGTRDFWIDEKEGGNNSLSKENTRGDAHVISVKMKSIDRFLEEHPINPDIVVMDIQGAEVLAFKGMKRLFREHPPKTMFLEFWPFGLRRVGSDIGEFRSILRANGYRLAHVDPGSPLPDPETHWEELVRHCDTVKNGRGFCNLVAKFP